MAAAFMQFQLHGWDIHVVRPGTGVASVTEVPFPPGSVGTAIGSAGSWTCGAVP